MGYAELIAMLERLPAERRAEVFDFASFLAARQHGSASSEVGAEDWSAAEFGQMSMAQALRGMEDESVTYTRDDIKECWQ